MEALTKVWISLQKVMECTMEKKCGNDYKIPHMGKDKLNLDYMKPYNVQCEKELISGIKNILDKV